MPADLAALIKEGERLCREATPGPWEAEDCGMTGEIPEVIWNDPDGTDWLPVCYFNNASGDCPADRIDENRAFIAYARTALPLLLRLVKAGAEMREGAQRLLDYHDRCQMTSTHGTACADGIAAWDAAASAGEGK